MKALGALAAAGMLLCSLPAQAGVMVLDFNAFSDGTNIAGVNLGSAVVSAGGGDVLVNAGAIGPAGTFRVEFTMFGVISVGIDLADTGSGLEGLFLSAYDGSSMLLGTTTASGSTAFLSMFAPALSYVEFGSSGSSQVTADNLRIESIDVGGSAGLETVASTPIPGALPLLLTGLAGAAYLGSRRRR